jgi:hypothetical protein
MKGFHWLIAMVAALTRDTVAKLLTAEVQVGARLALEESFAQAEAYAVEFERQGQPRLAAAKRAECAKLRAESLATVPTPPSTPPVVQTEPVQSLPTVPPANGLPERKKPGRKPALKASPEPAGTLVPPAQFPWSK